MWETPFQTCGSLGNGPRGCNHFRQFLAAMWPASGRRLMRQPNTELHRLFARARAPSSKAGAAEASRLGACVEGTTRTPAAERIVALGLDPAESEHMVHGTR